MKTPDWYREAVASHGERVALGAETQADAAEAVAALLAGHPEFLASIAGRDVGKWAEKHGQGDLFHEALFPAIPALMTVAPTVKMRTGDMTLRDLEMARVMLTVRTGNSINSAKKERRDFARFYRKVKPLLKDGGTVADVMPLLAAQDEAAAA